jgi:hypothetical protein
MHALLQCIEVKAVASSDDDLAVDDTARRQQPFTRIVEFGKVAIKRTQIAALDERVVRCAKDDRAKPVPFRLVEQLADGRKLLHRLGEHWSYGWSDRIACVASHDVIVSAFHV